METVPIGPEVQSMRPWNVVVSMAMAALGVTAWWFSGRVAQQECPPADSTCVALEQMAYLLLSAALTAASILILFVRVRRRDESTTAECRFPFEDGRVGDVPDVLFD